MEERTPQRVENKLNFNDFRRFGRVLAHDFCSKFNVFGGFGRVLAHDFCSKFNVFGGFWETVEAVPAQAIEVTGSGVAAHYSLTTPARG